MSLSCRFLALGVLLLAVALSPTALQAADKAATPSAATPTGLLLQRDAAGKKWLVVKEGEPLAAGQLVVGLPGAAIDSPNKAVRLSLLADLDGRSQYPVLESAVQPLATEKADLEFVLDRGRIELVNRKETGGADVVVRFRKEVWRLQLAEPGARAALELYGRWPRGVFFHPGAKPEEPAGMLVLIVLKGQVELKAGPHTFEMKAPPGPALLTWDSIGGDEPAPKILDKLPEWADPNAKPTKEGEERKARVEKVRQKLATETPDAVVAGLLAADEPLARRGGLILAGATDDLPRLIDALADPKRVDVRENAIMVLRHWIGRGPGQDAQLYAALQTDKKYTAPQAELILQGLHSLGTAELARPETYEALINYLRHPKLAVRELAKYHLYRLVPDAEKIAYDPAGPEAGREAAYKAWKELIPDGKLPPRPSKDPEPKEKN